MILISKKLLVLILSPSPPPAKLVKMPSNIITEPLTTAISNCLTQNVFSKIAKIALVTPINKGKSNKYEVSIADQ